MHVLARAVRRATRQSERVVRAGGGAGQGLTGEEKKRRDQDGTCHDDPVMGQLRAISGRASTRRLASRHLLSQELQPPFADLRWSPRLR